MYWLQHNEINQASVFCGDFFVCFFFVFECSMYINFDYLEDVIMLYLSEYINKIYSL